MPTWLHFRMKFPPRCPPSCPQDALGRPSLAPKTAQEPPNRRPRCAKSHPRAAPEPSRKRPTGALGRRHATKQPQTPSKPRFLKMLATIWKDFGIILDGFLEGFWKAFKTNWIHILATIRLQCWGGCAPLDPAPLLRGKLGGGNAALRR